MLLTLLDSKEKIPVAGQVVWVTPAGAGRNRTAGIGVQFGEKDSGVAQTKIEAICKWRAQLGSTHTHDVNTTCYARFTVHGSQTDRSPITDHGNTPYSEGLRNENVDSIQHKDFICGF